MNNKNLRKIALFDIDNTIYDGFLIFSLAKYQVRKKIIKPNCLKVFYKDLKLYKTSKIDYETTIANLLIHWAEDLKGISYDTVLKQTKTFFKNEKNKFFPYFKSVILLLRKTHDFYFVTAEPEFIGKALSDLFKMAGFISSKFEVKNGFFTGKVKTFLARGEKKRKAVRQLLKQHDMEDSFAFGDSEGDIEMMSVVEFPICINPTPLLRKIATKKSWPIILPEEVEKLVIGLLSNRRNKLR